MRIAMIGTRGVPSRYGGFETAVEEIGSRLARRHDVTVFCRSGDKSLTKYRGMRLVHLPAIHHKAAETLSHTALSICHRRAWTADMAFVFNSANAPLVPLLKRAGVRVAVHVDGLEWQRAKWSGLGQRYYRWSERVAVRVADALIADARGIQQYYDDAHGAATTFIPYGAPILDSPSLGRLAELGLDPGGYHVVVARLEPENHVDVIVGGYLRSSARLPLVIVGSAPYADSYVAELTAHTRRADERVLMVGSVWDQELLDAIYAGAVTYLHGHSVGGTNPSLLRAMGAQACTLAYDVSFNREVLGDTGWFWSDEPEVAELLQRAEADGDAVAALGAAAQQRAAQLYRWDDVANEYELLATHLMAADKYFRRHTLSR